tara:strand:+ start:512 stop:850 length:339 start_codon:yes stop_codon:yes gene_type:complete
MKQKGLNRYWVDHPFYGKETIGEYLERQKVKQTSSGKFILYHGTPKVGGATNSLWKGTLLEFDEESARHFAQRDRDINSKDIVVHELHLDPDEIDGGVFPSLRMAIDLEVEA